MNAQIAEDTIKKLYVRIAESIAILDLAAWSINGRVRKEPVDAIYGAIELLESCQDELAEDVPC